MTESKLKLYETVVGPMWLYSEDLIGGLTMGPGENLWDGKLLIPFFDRWARPDATAIDIGASYGQNAIYLSRICKQVYAVEPILCEVMMMNLRMNDALNVRPIGLAAFDRLGALDLAPDEAQGQAVLGKPLEEIGNIGGIAFQWRDGGKYICTRLDQLLPPSAPPVCLIKSDTQGCDLRALRGCTEIIKRDRPAILFEFEEKLAQLHGDTWRDYSNFFGDLRYALEEQVGIGYPNNFVALPKGKGEV